MVSGITVEYLRRAVLRRVPMSQVAPVEEEKTLCHPSLLLRMTKAYGNNLGNLGAWLLLQLKPTNQANVTSEQAPGTV